MNPRIVPDPIFVVPPRLKFLFMLGAAGIAAVITSSQLRQVRKAKTAKRAAKQAAAAPKQRTQAPAANDPWLRREPPPLKRALASGPRTGASRTAAAPQAKTPAPAR